MAHKGSLIFNEANKSGKVWTVEKKSAERTMITVWKGPRRVEQSDHFHRSNKEEFEAFDFEELLFLEDDSFFNDGADSVPFANLSQCHFFVMIVVAQIYLY